MTLTVTAPAAGTVLVHGNVSVQVSHVLNTEDTVQIGIGTTATDCGNFYDRSLIEIPAAWPAFSTKEMTTSTENTFPVAAGTTTFYLNGQSLSGVSSSDVMYWGLMNAVFIPN